MLIMSCQTANMKCKDLRTSIRFMNDQPGLFIYNTQGVITDENGDAIMRPRKSLRQYFRERIEYLESRYCCDSVRIIIASEMLSCDVNYLHPRLPYGFIKEPDYDALRARQ